jgi:hypothetical protein
MFAIVKCCLLSAVACVAVSSASANEADLTKLAWLGGCWASANGEPGSGEQWMPLAGGTLLGMSRTVKNGRTVEFEFMQIRIDQGAIVYIAMPSGQRTATFTAIRLTDSEVVFENKAHDFPQRVIYRIDGDQLLARIEGERAGVLRSIPFTMNRSACH